MAHFITACLVLNWNEDVWVLLIIFSPPAVLINESGVQDDDLVETKAPRFVKLRIVSV